jgi:hypothetical protein
MTCSLTSLVGNSSPTSAFHSTSSFGLSARGPPGLDLGLRHLRPHPHRAWVRNHESFHRHFLSRLDRVLKEHKVLMRMHSGARHGWP